MAAKLARFSWLPGGLAAALVIAVGRLITSSSAPLELSIYDRVQRARSVQPAAEVVVVAIDQASIEQLGDWPWPKGVHAALVNRLHAQGARVIAFTTPLDPTPARRNQDLNGVRAALTLLESSDLGASEQANQLRVLLSDSSASGTGPLVSALAAHGDVIAPILLDGAATGAPQDIPARLLPRASQKALSSAPSAQVSHAPSAALLEKLSAVGHVQFTPDADGVVRTDLTAVRVGDALLPSIATALAARASGMSGEQLAFNTDGRLVIGHQVLPVQDDLRTRPHFLAANARESFVQIPYWQALAGESAEQLVRDKLVLVGITAPALGMQNTILPPDGSRTPMVLAVASATSSLLKGAVYSHSTTAVAVEWTTGVLVIAFAALVLPTAGVGLGAFATLLLVALLGVTEVGLLTSAQIWVQLMLPAAAAIAGFGMYAIAQAIRRGYASGARDPSDSLRSLGQTFQGQGQLDLAFETYQRCPLDARMMDLLYQLGLDFERRRQLQKAAAVYTHLATRDPNYRDLRARRARVVDEPMAREATKPAQPLTPVENSAPKRRVEAEDYEPQVEPRRSSRKLGRYEIERELGKGAMGVVYLGRDPKINRVVAIKAIPLAEEFEEGDLEEARARFFREAEMAGRLNHPSIVTVYDAGEDQGLAYIAMEYLRGQHLNHHTDPNRLLPPRTVMLLVARVAEALHYAHRQNVVHRDIKPANIMFNPDTDELKITDFGIARLTDTSRTKTGIVLGTPSFMSPEQLEGRPLDGRSDQFALGVSFYQLLSGHLPFRAESMPRLMQKIATEPHAPVRVIRPELPEAIDAVFDRALAKDADDRYATCTDFAVALRKCAESIGEPGREAAHEWLLP